MKVLHIIPTYYPAYSHGGPTWSVHNLNKWLVKKGVDVTVYTTNIDGRGSLDVPVNQPVDVDGVKVFYFQKSFPRFWAYSRDLHKTLSKTAGEFDLIHITSTFLSASALGGYYARKNKVPYIISPRGNLMKEPVKKKGFLKKIFYIGLIEEKNLQNAAAIHFTVPKEKQEYEELGFTYQNSIIIPNGIDPESFESAPQGHFKEKFNIPQDKKIILFLSRLTWKKGLDTLIPAFSKVVKEYPNALLVIAGNGDASYKRKVEGWIKENNIENNVIFTGMITGKDRTAAYQDSDIFTLSSYSENFGMAVVEAMNFALPVVITENIGIADEIRLSDSGVVVSKDKDQVASGILKLLQNESFAKNTGERGMNLVAQKYIMSQIADRWVEAYGDIIR